MTLNAENAASSRWTSHEDEVLKRLTESLTPGGFRPHWDRITSNFNANVTCMTRTSKSVRNRFIRLSKMKPKKPKPDVAKKKKKKKKKTVVVVEGSE
jgi:hypothetical protein